MKNWKSTLAFFMFLGIYAYSVYNPSTDNVINTTGYIALIMAVIMVLRNEITTRLLDKMLDVYKNRK